jgi:hypothetical protein
MDCQTAFAVFRSAGDQVAKARAIIEREDVSIVMEQGVRQRRKTRIGLLLGAPASSSAYWMRSRHCLA